MSNEELLELLKVRFEQIDRRFDPYLRSERPCG